jgi:hypothetical protein
MGSSTQWIGASLRFAIAGVVAIVGVAMELKGKTANKNRVMVLTRVK